MKIGAQHIQIWNTIKIVLRGNFIALTASIKNLESTHTSNLKVNILTLEKRGINHAYQRAVEASNK